MKRFCFRPLAPGEFDFERCAAVVLAGVGVVAWGWLALGLPLPGCMFFKITGLPCVSCGGTRALLCLLEGRFSEALNFNPLVCLGLCLVAMFEVYALIAVLVGRRRARFIGVPERVRKGLIAAGCALVCANWVFVVLRLRA